jgi:hypothetical protein
MAQSQLAWPELATRYSAVTRARNKRAEHRYTVPRGLTMNVRIVPTTRTVEGELRNVSRRGVALLTHEFIPTGSYISFPFSNTRVFAQVRHCRLTRIGFVLGAHVTDVLRMDGTVGDLLEL